jgi:hypothetical protein
MYGQLDLLPTYLTPKGLYVPRVAKLDLSNVT